MLTALEENLIALNSTKDQAGNQHSYTIQVLFDNVVSTHFYPFQRLFSQQQQQKRENM